MTFILQRGSSLSSFYHAEQVFNIEEELSNER